MLQVTVYLLRPEGFKTQTKILKKKKIIIIFSKFFMELVRKSLGEWLWVGGGLMGGRLGAP